MQNIKIWAGEIAGYRLLDSGDKEKLEEINGVKIVRSEPRAWWPKSLPKEAWQNSQKSLETELEIFDGLKAKIKFKPSSKHIGIFPEQVGQWRWIFEKLKNLNLEGDKKEANVLSLFGYTGLATLAAAKAGAKVTHVDASKQAIDWARENQHISGLQGAAVRWIVDDVVKFVNKEARQGKRYDAIILDPPSYGKGPKGEIWKIEEELPELLKACRAILSEEPLFIIFNMYSTELSSISVVNLLSSLTKDLGGQIEAGELAIREESGRLLPMSIFALWQKDYQ